MAVFDRPATRWSVMRCRRSVTWSSLVLGCLVMVIG
jgi:hypothetical protein